MNLKKIVLLLFGAAATFTILVCLLSVGNLVNREGTRQLRASMTTMLDAADHARRSTAALRQVQAFDEDKLRQTAQQSGNFRDSAMYKTVPVVAAWESIRGLAEKDGFSFRVPAEDARNPENTPRQDEREILNWLASHRGEDYFSLDDKRGEVVMARAVTLSHDCLVCHGDPANSPSKDGKDVLGFRMEGWRSGEMHGAFVLRGSTAAMNGRKRAQMLETAAWIIGTKVIVILCVLLAWRKVQVRLRHGLGRILEEGEKLESAIHRISQQSSALESVSSEQTASFEETSAAIEEIRGVSRSHLDSSQHAARAMEACSLEAQAGDRSLTSLHEAMSSIRESTGRIAKIIRMMDEIAFQTNILALNAAVEAARAGEAGQGFSVVADEVRNLARRSADAAKEIEQIINDSVTRADFAGKAVAEVSATTKTINAEISTLRKTLAEVAAGTQEQFRGIDGISDAMNRISRMTLEVSGAAANGRQECDQLKQQAAQLRESSDDLSRLLV